MSGVNPYAPPTTPENGQDLPDAPLSSGWALAGDTILVWQGAQLPMVDPFTGISSDRMTLRLITINYSPSWHRAMIAASIFCFVAGGFFHLPTSVINVLFGIGGITALIYLVPATFFFKGVRLRIFTSTPSNRKIRLGSVLNSASAFTLILLIALGSFDLTHPFVLAGISMLFGFLLIAAICYRMLSRNLRCHRKIGDRHEIRGIHPDAIGVLVEMEEKRPRSTSSGH